MPQPSARAQNRTEIENDLEPVHQLALGHPRLIPGDETPAASHRVASPFLHQPFSPAAAKDLLLDPPAVVPQSQGHLVLEQRSPMWRGGAKQALPGLAVPQPGDRQRATWAARF